MPRLPFRPLTIDMHKQRWPHAVKDIYNLNDDSARPRVHEQIKHYFDFHDGIRIIAAREQMDETVFLHVSSSIYPESNLAQQIIDDTLPLQQWQQMVIDRVIAIGGPRTTFGFYSPGYIAHFFNPPIPKEML